LESGCGRRVRAGRDLIEPTPMPSFRTSFAAAPRLDHARAWLAAGGARPSVVLAASRRAGQQLVRETAAAAGGLFGAHVSTVPQLAGELAHGGGNDATPLTALGAEAIVARALARCRGEAPFAFLAAVANAPGLPRALVRTLGELRHHRIGPAALAALGDRGEDLARILDAYEAELDRARLADGAALLAAAADRVMEDPHARHVEVRLLLLDLSLRSPLEEALVATVAKRAPDVLAIAPAADGRGVAKLERALGTSAAALEEPTPGDRAVARARSHVFRPDTTPPQTPLDDGFALVSAPGEGAECVEIARRLLDLARQGTPFDRCAVLLRDPERYQPLLEGALDRAGVPALFTRGVVRPHPAGRALLALLDCALERLSANRFAEYLSLGQVPPVDAEGAAPERPVPWLEPDEEERLGALPREGVESASGGGDTRAAVDAAAAAAEVAEDDSSPVIAGSLRTPLNWERLLVEASVIGGLDRWRRRLGGLRHELEVHLAASEGDDPGRVAHLERQLQRLATLERFALPLVEALAELPQAALWARWLEQLERLATRALREPARVLETLAELRPMAEVGPVSLAEVRLALADRLTNLRASPLGTPFGRLFVGGLDEARGRSFDTVFLPGLVEGVFPRKALEDPLLLDENRRALADATPSRAPLPTQDERVADERLLLALALGAAESRLIASFPTLDGREGRVRVPSFYALDLARAVEGTLPAHGTLLRKAAGASALLRGWPAPRVPEASIDDAEYDLAVLAPLLNSSGAESRGRARFLLQLEPALARSLRARWARWSRKFTPADGLVEPDSAAWEVLVNALATRAFSATALQTLAACPYRFALHALHGLRPREEALPLEELDPLTKGEIFHAIQASWLGEMKRRGALPLAAEGRSEALDLLDNTLARLAADYRERLAPALPRVWESEIEEMRVDLRGWVREMTDGASVGGASGAGASGGGTSGRETSGKETWVPSFFELAFGLPADAARDPASRPAPVDILGKLRLRGAIDLVETSADGTLLRATDHKTGRPPDTQLITIGHGETLQPLLYAIAAGELLGKPARSGRLYFCTRRGGYRVFEVPLHDLNLYALRCVLELLEHSLTSGFLPAAPREGACARCDYRPVCGPWEELRVKRKPKADLERLLDVRRYE
jgi:RecB family exonuclease